MQTIGAEQQRRNNLSPLRGNKARTRTGQIDGFDVLIHLAAIPAPGGYPEHVVHNNNVTSSYNALLAAAKVGIKRVVQASSINAIGAVYSRWPTYEFLPRR